MDTTHTLTVRADIHEIPRVSGAIEETMRTAGFPDEAILDVQLAVEEAIANTIVHGFRGATGEVTVTIHVAEDMVTARVEDRAPPFDPLSLPEPNRESDLAERHIGGLGIYLMRRVVDEVTYQYVEGKNVLTLIKKKQPDRSGKSLT